MSDGYVTKTVSVAIDFDTPIIFPPPWFENLEDMPFWKRVKACWYFLTTKPAKVRAARREHMVYKDAVQYITDKEDERILEMISDHSINIQSHAQEG